MAASILLIVPAGQDRRVKIKLSTEVAAWLHDQLTAAIGKPPRRPVRLRRGKWLNKERVMGKLSAAAMTAAVWLSAAPAWAWQATGLDYDHASGVAKCLTMERQDDDVAIGVLKFVDLQGGTVQALMVWAPTRNHYETLYAAVDDQGFEGQGTIPVTLELLTALQSGTRLHLSWPPRDRLDRASVSLDGFSAAYDECTAKITERLDLAREGHR
jgi:hypothetical protein